MKKSILTRKVLLILWGWIATFSAIAQNKLSPVYPASTPDLIFIEAEYAVSTNFAKEPILNYGCSGSRTLQLNRNVGLFGNAPFYAEFVFLVQEEGSYELWYGGTPPGPKDDFLPSFASPFTIRLDDGQPQPVYREDMHVVENYAPAYYWNLVKTPLNLKPGIHTLRVEVTERRRHDNRFFFYLDALFLRKVGSSSTPPNPMVKFPKDPSNRRIDNPFGTIQEYEETLKKDPRDIRNYIYLSLVYSLVGDYSNALRVLRRGAAIEPKNESILLLSAKNRIWKGDIVEGINGYKSYLVAYPDNLEIWREAGKVAAWVGKYQDSEWFYLNALNRFPGDPSLLVNLGLTYLWQSINQKAEGKFQEALEKSLESPESLKLLAEIYKVNGYPDRSVSIYQKGVEAFPTELEFYLLLADTLIRLGKEEEAQKVYALVEERFESSDQLTAYLALAKQQAEMRNRVIEEYRKKLETDPDNLSLRETLVETYFWNGLRDRAIEEYYTILATHTFRQLKEFDTTQKDLLELASSLYLLNAYFRETQGIANSLRSEASTALSSYNDALTQAKRFEERLQAATQRGETVPIPEKGDPREILRAEEEKLSTMEEKINAFLERFESNDQKVEEYAQKVSTVAETQKTAMEEFSRLAQPLNWRWDRPFYVDELSRLVASAPVIAAHALGRIHQLTGPLAEAERLYRKALEAPQPQAVSTYALWETLIWRGDREGRKSLLDSPVGEKINQYTSLRKPLEQLDAELRDQKVRTSVFTEQTPDRVKEQIQALGKARAKASIRAGELDKFIQTTRFFLTKGLERSFFDLQEKTLLLRFELGDYLLSANRLVEATRQLRHVLAMEPSNLNALYKLGVVRQLYGDWHEAMSFYRRVYGLDPTFELTATYHNQLARLHPNRLETEVRTFADTSRITTTAEGSYTHALNSVASLKTFLRTESLRMYKQNAWSTASNHQLHTLVLSLPLDFYNLGLGLTPRAGMDLPSTAYDTGGGYTGSDVPSLPWFFSTYRAYPNLGIEGRISIRSVSLIPAYGYGRERDTFIPGRDSIFKQQGELTILSPITFNTRYGLTLINSRTYGSLSFLSDGNRKGTAVQDTTFYFHVADSPWTTVGLSTVLVFEHAQRYPNPEQYYAPNGVFVAKAGPLGSTYIDLKNGTVLGLIFQTLVGLYREKSFSSAAENKLYLDGLIKTELSLENTTLFLSVYGSGSFTSSNPDYWSVQVQVGVTQKVLRLLAP